MPSTWALSNPVSGESVSNYMLRQLPEHATGYVHSVFQTSFNVKVGEFLVHVGSTSSPLSCLGLNIDPKRMQELLPCIRQGDRGIFRSGTLRIYNQQQVSTIDYGSFPTEDLHVGERTELTGPALLTQLRHMNLQERIGIRWDNALEQALCSLRNPKADAASLEAAITFLIGRGLGLTPSGDDILLGYGAGLQAWGNPELFCSILRAMLNRQTTDVSIAYLNAMLDRYVNADYHALFSAVRAGREAAYPALLEAISHHGHTSGCDSLLGLLTAVELLCSA